MTNRTLFFTRRVRLALIAVFIGHSCYLCAGASEDKTFTPAELRQDLSAAVHAMQEVQPSLYAHQSKAEFEKKVAVVRRELVGPMTSLQFFRALAPLLASVHCYHTWLLPSSNDMEAFETNTGVLPLDVVVRPEGVFVRKDVGSGAHLAPGTRIKSIAGRDVSSAVAALLENYDLGVDGVGVQPRYTKLSRPGYFARVFALYFQDPPPTHVEIVASGEKTAKTISITPMKAGELLKALSPSNAPFNLMFLAGNSAAVLTVSSFGESPDYEGFLKNAFTQLRERRVKNLIIDLRNNGGGEDRNSMLLYSYIAKAPFRYYTSLISNSDHFEAARNDTDFPAEAFRKRAIPAPGGRFQVRESAHPGLRLQQPLPLAFQGNVYCLVNGLTGSAASEFSAVAYSAGLASFIGEETGGGYLFDTSGPQVHVELPNTKVRVVIPTVRYNLAVKPEFQHHGLIPAEKVLPTLENIITSHDVVLQRALGLIQQSQAQRAKVH